MSDAWWRGKRGEWYVVVQALLLSLLAVGPRTAPGLPLWPVAFRLPGLIAGGLLMLVGAVLACAGLCALGHNLTPLPRPKEAGELVTAGPYRLVRHPVYGGILLMGCGWTLIARSWLTLCYLVVVFCFLDLKSRREERWLMAKYPGYREYRRRVRKLVPFLY